MHQDIWRIANVTAAPNVRCFHRGSTRLIKLLSLVRRVRVRPFAGSGTTGRAAVFAGRNAICVDQSDEYVRLMKDWRASLNGDKWASFMSKATASPSQRAASLTIRSDLSGSRVLRTGTRTMEIGPTTWARQSCPAFIESLRPAFEEVCRTRARRVRSSLLSLRT